MPSAALSALDALRTVWGYPGFRPGQAEAIGALLGGRDVLAVLPTGGGKSVLYQVPPVAARGLALVVSPLIALMEDQVGALARRGVPAALASSRLSLREQDQLWTDAEFGKYRLVYVTPERLTTDLFRARAPRLALTLLAVDEAHCISEWGHDFRPAYRRIAEVRPLLRTAGGGRVPTAALTGSATPEVRRDIAEQLGLDDPLLIAEGFDRPNLFWAVRQTEDKAGAVRDLLRETPGSGLVYAGTRRGTEDWARTLRASGVSAEAYHAGLDGAKRTAVQGRWLDGKTRVVAATSAFGMGIDKPDVRFVVHVALPPTVEAYVQEAGRAGRDGEPARALMLVGPDDEALPRALALDGHPEARAVRAVYDAVGSVAGLALGSEADGPVVVDPAVIARVTGLSPRAVRAAAERLEAAGAWSLGPERIDSAFVRVAHAPGAFMRLASEAGPPALAAFVENLVRGLPPEAFHDGADVRLDALAARTGMPVPRLLAGLAWLSERGLLRVLPPGEGLRVSWNGPRLASAPIDARALNEARRRALVRLDHVVGYVQALGCRRQHLLAYFGQDAPAACGRCDVCQGALRAPLVTPEDEPLLRRLLREASAGSPREAWLEGVSSARRDALASWLLREGHLVLRDPLGGAYEVSPKAARLATEA